jgi:hypothetical protein
MELVTVPIREDNGGDEEETVQGGAQKNAGEEESPVLTYAVLAGSIEVLWGVTTHELCLLGKDTHTHTPSLNSGNCHLH